MSFELKIYFQFDENPHSNFSAMLLSVNVINGYCSFSFFFSFFNRSIKFDFDRKQQKERN